MATVIGGTTTTGVKTQTIVTRGRDATSTGTSASLKVEHNDTTPAAVSATTKQETVAIIAIISRIADATRNARVTDVFSNN